ncbi:MAG TPA: hypothetical protein VL979_07925 [Solirubrobacteraceae bacterium]|nr:hypothetical protein [Solirubrobacteraceae bacterium]
MIDPTILEIPASIADATQQHLRDKGRSSAEGVVLWVGPPNGPVCHVLIPVQITSRLRYQVPLDERQRISRALAGTGEIVVAQVHSHEGPAFHSLVDDEEAIVRRPGGYSLVVPYFGTRPTLLDGAALFRLASAGSWDEVPIGQLRVRELDRR